MYAAALGIVVIALVCFGLAIWKYFKPRVVMAERRGRMEIIDEFSELAETSGTKTKGANIDKKISVVKNADDIVTKIEESL
jgi:hypothetical protein